MQSRGGSDKGIKMNFKVSALVALDHKGPRILKLRKLDRLLGNG
jgi:hypothetical protein